SSWTVENQGVPGGAVWSTSDDQAPSTPSAQLVASAQLGQQGQGQFLSAVQELGQTVTWSANLPTAGRYRLLAYIPYLYNGLDESQGAHYLVRSAEGLTDVEVDQGLMVNDWADLGTYRFDPQGGASVTLSNRTGVPGQGVWAGE